MAEAKQHQSQYKGWLYKWTNYLKGYQKRWFVLQNGLLSYYRNQAEMAHTCRGTINLATALIHTEDSCTIVISNSGTQTFHLKATSEVERQKWVTALELAKSDAARLIQPDSDDEEAPDKDEIQTTLKNLTSKLEDLNTCNDLIGKHGSGLQRSLSELEQTDNVADMSSKSKVINERATMFRITSNAMINACAEFLDLATTEGKRWQKMIQHEHNQKLKLQELLEQLAKDQNTLERQAKKSMHSIEAGALSGSDEENFEDAIDYQDIVTMPQTPGHHRTDSTISIESRYSTESDASDSEVSNPRDVVTYPADKQYKQKKSKKYQQKLNSESTTLQPSQPFDLTSAVVSKKQRRMLIAPKPNYSLNLWGIMKNCIGKELSKIPMPVNFSEPLSMLQRLTEDFEYSQILDYAATLEDSTEQMCHVAAFTISAYSTTTNRTTKPFNPLLGETYECDRTDDFGWRSLAEQVSHHPPTAALMTEGRGWKLWQEFTMGSKFRGRYLQIVPTGMAHLTFNNTGNHYTWRKVTTTVHNIIVGKLWVDHHGEMDITNHTTNDKCHLKYLAYSYFSRDTPRKVTGVVTDKDDNAKWVLTGTWDNHVESAPIVHVDDTTKRAMFATGPKKSLWKRVHPPPGAEKMYYFTRLAIQLNEADHTVAPTDSRNRPDQRLMEEGNWDDANKAKILLEENQRSRRKRQEAEAEEATKNGEEYDGHKPRWFNKQQDPKSGHTMHVFNNQYWECKHKQEWNDCPDLFGP